MVVLDGPGRAAGFGGVVFAGRRCLALRLVRNWRGVPDC